MIILLLAIATAYIFLLVLTKDRYTEEIKIVNQKQYPLKGLMAPSLWLLDCTHYSYNTKYDQKVLTNLSDLYGYNSARFYLKIHWSHKITVIFLLLFIMLVIAVITGSADGIFITFGLGVIAAVFYAADHEVIQKANKRKVLIRYDFPEFMNKLILLVNAGMTVLRAWEKIVTDHKSDRPLYRELRITFLQIQSGKPEQQAYEELARRCKTPELTKFISVIIQHLRKGNADLVPTLRLQAFECWEMRKTVAKRLGEEASTKMIFPMMIMFLAILMIVITPAIMAIMY